MKIQLCYSCLIFLLIHLTENHQIDNYLSKKCKTPEGNLIISEFGKCGSIVKLNKHLLNEDTLHIRYDNIEEAIKNSKFGESYAIVLYTENGYIQWLVFFQNICGTI
uniref:Uncharacterized protein n=1 Tax=Trichobilharzia regenti TaxID=157069 RepID=A0AA85KBK6_TRIRE|nr:unnamed protein product [Trichobilharzia regenti]